MVTVWAYIQIMDFSTDQSSGYSAIILKAVKGLSEKAPVGLHTQCARNFYIFM